MTPYDTGNKKKKVSRVKERKGGGNRRMGKGERIKNRDGKGGA